MMSAMRQKALQAAEGKTDLLLRFFESSFFDEWIALVYLYQNQGPGVHDYLCNKLYELPEHSLEKYLLQFVYLAVSRPGSALERVIIDYCSKSFRVAVKVYWLLLAITQDQPKNRHVDSLKEACEKAALEGRWEVPFNPTLDPLSPAHPAERAWSPPLAVHSTDSLAVLPNCPPRDADAWAELPHFLGQGVEEVLCMQPFHHIKDKLLHSQAHDAPERSSGSLNERCHDLRQQLGEGEGVTALLAKSRHCAAAGGPGCVSAHYVDDDRSPMCDRPVSPTTRLRHNTFGATLDFMQELCDASSTLTSITQEQRQMALHSALDSINQAIDSSSKEDMAIWFPMGSGRERILRLTTNEAVLLNSREKAPFMLFVEVLKEDQEDDLMPAPVRSASNGAMDTRDGPERSAKSWATTRSNSNYAESAKSLFDSSSEATHPVSRPSTADPTHPPTAPESPTAPAPPAPPAPAPTAPPPARPPAIVIDPSTLSHSEPCPPPAAPPAAAQPPTQPLSSNSLPPRPRAPPASTPTTRLLSPRSPFASLSSLPSLPDALRLPLATKSSSDSALKHAQAGSQASSGKEAGILKGIAQKSIGLARALKEHASSSGSEGPLSNERLAELVSAASNSNTAAAPARPTNPIIKRMDDAMASLRGDAPLVRVHITSLELDPFDAAASDSSALADADRRRMAAEAGPSGLRKAGGEEAGAGAFKALNLFSKLSLCRKGGFLEGESPHGQRQQRLVSVRLEVAAAVNLPIPSPYRRSRRVPSQDAIDAIADKYHILTIPPPVDIGPPLKRPAPSRPPTIYSPRNPAAHASFDAAPFPEPPSTPDPIAPEPPVPKPPSSRGPSPTPSILNALPLPGAVPSVPSLPSEPTSPTVPAFRPRPASPSVASPTPTSPTATSTMLRKQREANAVYGERWRDRVDRIRRESPQGRRKGWALRCAIVKSGDDCRQELLAVQLIRTFHDIFQECGLPLWVRPYEVLVTSNRTALIELIPDCLSIHTVKHRSPPGTSLSDHFFAKFGHGTPQCATAQRKFTESMAAYSIICYILQIKDRHNGNIMLDDEGRVVHIDFGFMLSNSPGGVNFESAPFKLTRELLEVMDSTSEGKPSELFDYFKVLCIQGFLAARKHSDRIVQLVRMMARSGFPCFKAGDRTVKNLEKRFHLNLTEVQCVQVVLGLISESLDAWRMRQYDYYQRVVNGIL